LTLAGFIVVAWVRAQDEWPFQKRNLAIAQIVIVDRHSAPGVVDVSVARAEPAAADASRLAVGLAVLGAALFRIRGHERRHAAHRRISLGQTSGISNRIRLAAPISSPTATDSRPDFPQYLGLNRDGVLAPEQNWKPTGSRIRTEVLWRQKGRRGLVGLRYRWCGLALLRSSGAQTTASLPMNCSPANSSGVHTTAARYDTVIAGEGPRATPTVVSNRVFACGGTGILNCLDLATGKLVWSRDLVAGVWRENSAMGLHLRAVGRGLIWSSFMGAKGFRARCSHSISLMANVSGRVARAVRVTPRPCSPRWQACRKSSHSTTAASPVITRSRARRCGKRPWGNGNVVCAAPVVISTNQVLFSSGYGVGAELLEISPGQQRIASPPGSSGNPSA
jgi:hypothetical protein